MCRNMCSRRGTFRYDPRTMSDLGDDTDTLQTTVNLKKVELPVKQIVSGKTIKPSGTLANPESLKYYEQFAKDEVLQSADKGGAPQLKSKL